MHIQIDPPTHTHTCLINLGQNQNLLSDPLKSHLPDSCRRIHEAESFNPKSCFQMFECFWRLLLWWPPRSPASSLRGSAEVPPPSVGVSPADALTVSASHLSWHSFGKQQSEHTSWQLLSQQQLIWKFITPQPAASPPPHPETSPHLWRVWPKVSVSCCKYFDTEKLYRAKESNTGRHWSKVRSYFLMSPPPHPWI